MFRSCGRFSTSPRRRSMPPKRMAMQSPSLPTPFPHPIIYEFIGEYTGVTVSGPGRHFIQIRNLGQRLEASRCISRWSAINQPTRLLR